MTRRNFAFWLGFGLFSLADCLRIQSLDALAAALMDEAALGAPPEHWTAAEDDAWTWFEREHFIDNQWILTGTTTPIHKETGERKEESGAYLDERLLPKEMRPAAHDKADTGDVANTETQAADSADEETAQSDLQIPTAGRRARHGRPPSKWLRSLNADEIRIWLKTIQVPEAGVSGMTYWEHLTRDHGFDPIRIEGLSIEEQAKLHAAAHYGY
jgi:hypothetical protein